MSNKQDVYKRQLLLESKRERGGFMRLIGWIRQRLDRLSELQLNIYAANASFFILLAAIPSLSLIHI